MSEGPTFTAPDFGSNPIEYFKQVRLELARVEWPSRPQVIQATILVVVVSILVGSFLGAIDYAFTNLFGYILNR